jgi:mRNA interferase RelE/StbE
MKVLYGKKFLKQLAKLPESVRLKIETFVFNELTEITSLASIGKIEKMSGYSDYYKMRFGDYRLGLKLENETLMIQVIMHRKEIYKFFP